MTPDGFEIHAEVAAVHDGFEARVTAWAPSRAAHAAGAGTRRALTGRGPTRDYAESVAAALGDLLWRQMESAHGPGRPAADTRPGHLGLPEAAGEVS